MDLRGLAYRRVEGAFRRERWSEWAGGIVLFLAWFVGSLLHPARPGANPLHPEGWWGWTDQGLYLRSAQAFAHLDLRASEHWYPLVYPLLGAPFARLLPAHPFAVVDPLCLLLAYRGFLAFARHCRLGGPAAVLAFLLATMGSFSLRESWIVPWTTTLSAAAIWWLLALAVRHLDDPVAAGWRREQRLILLGLCSGLVVLCRPADLVIPALVLLCLAFCLLRDRTWRLADPAALLLGATAVALPYGLLHLAIYGPHPSQYVLNSRAIGFRAAVLPLKTLWLLDCPRPWFPYGSGLLERLPWIAGGLAGLLCLPLASSGTQRRGLLMLGLALLASTALLFAYVDLVPSGLWLYKNIHYFKWMMPGWALFGLLWLRLLCRSDTRRPAVAAAACVLALSALRLVPVRAAAGEPARALVYRGPTPPWGFYFIQTHLTDQAGTFENVISMRVLPTPDGFRVLSLGRPFQGLVRWNDPRGLQVGPGAPQRVRGQLKLGWPCWLPPYSCDHLRLVRSR